jgi:predicted ester cyclase
MSEQNKAAARKFYEEFFDKKNVAAVDEICQPDFVDHSPMPGMKPGLEGMKDMMGIFQKAFPDLKTHIEAMVAEGDAVATRFHITATHSGSMSGETPTGKQVTFHGHDWITFRDGKATGAWHQGDEAMVLAQLGIKPPA